MALYQLNSNKKYSILNANTLIDYYIKQKDIRNVNHTCNLVLTYYLGLRKKQLNNVMEWYYGEYIKPEESLEYIFNMYIQYTDELNEKILKYGVYLGYKTCLYHLLLLYYDHLNYFNEININQSNYIKSIIYNDCIYYGPSLYIIINYIQKNKAFEAYKQKIIYFKMMYVMYSSYIPHLNIIQEYNKFLYNVILYEILNNSHKINKNNNILSVIRKDILLLYIKNTLKSYIINYLYRPNGPFYKRALKSFNSLK